MSDPESRNRVRRSAGLALRLAIGGLLVWVVFRGTDWPELFAALWAANPHFLLLALVSTFCAHLTRVQRAVPVVRAAVPASYGVIFRAAQIGLLVNLALPLRLGDAARAFLMGRAIRIPIARSFMLVGLDRLSDLIGLLALVGVALVALPTGGAVELPPELVPGRTPLVVPDGVLATFAGLGVFAVCGAGILLSLLYTRTTWFLRAAAVAARPLPAAGEQRVHRALVELADGLHLLRSPSALLASLTFSLLAWSLGVCTMTAMALAFDLPIDWRTPLLMQAMVAAFILVPVAPGLIGQFHLGVVVALLMTLPGVAVPRAKAVAVATHLVSLAPILVYGGFSLAQERIGWGALVRGAARSDASDG